MKSVFRKLTQASAVPWLALMIGLLLVALVGASVSDHIAFTLLPVLANPFLLLMIFYKTRPERGPCLRSKE